MTWNGIGNPDRFSGAESAHSGVTRTGLAVRRAREVGVTRTGLALFPSPRSSSLPIVPTLYPIVPTCPYFVPDCPYFVPTLSLL